MSDTEELTVAIDGFLDPVTEPIETALTTLWQALRDMSLRPNYREAMRLLLGTGRTEGVEFQLDFHGRLDVEVILADGRHIQVRAWRGEWQSTTARTAARYRPEPRGEEGERPGRWGVRDLEAGGWVRQGLAPVEFHSRESAQAWIGRAVAASGYGGYQAADVTPAAR
ncbi:hypothetical protein ACWGB8_07730 [Kitasatospora sp. NPDC054939]